MLQKLSRSRYGVFWRLTVFVTLGTFTNAAKQFAKGKANLRLIGGDELVSLIFIHYEQFDSRYKGVLPLKRVYVPDPDEAGEE